VAGGILLVGSLLGAAVALAHPGPNALDSWGFAAIPHSARSSALIHVTDLGSAAVLVAATLAAGLVVVRRDRVRALSCVLGPAVVVGSVELVVKPLVGRHYEGVLSYPSGNVAALAAVAAAWVVAVPPRLRPVAAAVGTLATAAMAVAVVGLRWHYPSDALGGAVLGVGMVLFIDGALHWLLAGRVPLPSPNNPRRY
jgi:membrane-associated phospholipid phosphatase